MEFKTWQYLLRYSLAKPRALRGFREAIKNQTLSRDKLQGVVRTKIKKLVSIAYKNVPWYRKVLDRHNLDYKKITIKEEFNKIPVLTREELANNFEQFISENIDKEELKISTTGGSTGKPLKIGMDPEVVREIPKWQMLSWWGLSPIDNMATLYRGVPMSGVKRIALKLIRWPQKILYMDATNISKNNIQKFIDEYDHVKPKLIHGYVGALDAIADYILQNNINLSPPEVIWSTASPITSIQENKISKAFKAPICDQYGCSEIYFIAAECPHKEGLHIFVDSVKVEILDDNNKPVPDGEYGKIVITNLNEYSFPLIRYENGDKGRLLTKKCSCGLSLPLMDKVKGRISDNIELPNGTVLSGEYLTTIFDNYTETVKQFQVIQHKSDNITIKVVLSGSYHENNNVVSNVRDKLEKRINNQVKLRFECVERIPKKGGKIQFIIKE
ncbi:phenylacetate--CoA ligase family protein [Balneolaceae bacterium YR4-1]|uniref:Phenylacetate--CoA ligase family protein n=1 Tax=Halalkalibaculum roseum TaxID=2709311 RepID=A0A6M1SUZ3_9BACT|nr:phenylacetate--CoA ligase family protein [Halalkalibaculum roseum]NGP75946.1 phenylacetate--CoA ligase family protein [Halalkalibaculum roseum]